MMLLRRAKIVSLLGLLFAAWLAGEAMAAPPKPPTSDAPPLNLESGVEPLLPRAKRTAADEDRLTAGALYAEGRLLLDREDKLGAQRRFERSWRYDPSAESLLPEIVNLALENGYVEEAIRYALLAPSLSGKDAILLRRLAIQLSERGKWREALQMFEASTGKPKADELEITDLSSALLQLEIARLAFLTDQFERSASGFARVREAIEKPEQHGLTVDSARALLGNPEQTWSLMAEASLAARRFDEAAELCRKANEEKREEGRLAFRLARIRAAQGKRDEALEQLGAAFEHQFAPSSREPFDLLKKLLEDSSPDAETAGKRYLERLQALREKDPANLPLGYAYAQALVQAKLLPAAETLLAELLETQPSEIGYRQLAEIQQQQKKWPELAATLGAALTKAGTLGSLNSVLKSFLDDEATIAELLTVGVKQREAKTEAPRGQSWALGLVAIRAKRFDAAGENLAAALAEPQAKQSQIWLTWGVELFQADAFPKSAEVLQRMVDERAFPASEIPVYFYLSAAYELGGDTGAALRALKQGIARNPKAIQLESRLGWIQYHAKNYPAAEQAYREFIERFEKAVDGDSRSQLRQARLALSNVKLKLDRFPEAVECLEQVLDEFPDDQGALNDLGYLWAERGLHLHRALAMTQAAVVAEPNNMSYRDSLGWALYQLGRYEEAARELRLAAKPSLADGVLLDHLGDVEHRLGRDEAASAAWQNAATAFEKEGESEKLAAVKAKLASKQ